MADPFGVALKGEESYPKNDLRPHLKIPYVTVAVKG